MTAKDPIVVAEHLYKSYRPRAHQISLRHEAGKVLQRSLPRTRDGSGSGQDDVFWALRDVSFAIEQGESVAIVGRNGSGKTTLLRVLCGITRPARGFAAVRGRFATLIALGAGFNVERTGRENIYLNAAIQGVQPRQVRRYLDRIVEFAELEDFIDVPVKRYSSGMVTRLGFSIAAHISPEIIFVDEVLAVGDEVFQQKCIDRILEMKREGRTLLFVSHSAPTVRKVCERAIWLDHGKLMMDGNVNEVLNEYSHVSTHDDQ